MKKSSNRRWTIMLITAAIMILCLMQIESAFSDVTNGRSRADDKGIQTISYECPSSCHNWYIGVDDYGYSDWLIYFPSGTPSHEMLSGDWAAAIYYSGISTNPLSMWLTDQFIYPSFVTNSTFYSNIPASYTVVPSSGTSTISNNEVEIKIDVDMVCDGPVAMNLNPAGIPGSYVTSDTCIMFQTYTIKNVSGSDLDSVYFYQFLHGHPGNVEGPAVTEVYDPSVNNVLNYPEYHYDITMWAQSDYGNTEYIGFACDDTRPPTRFDLWHFRGHSGRPPIGLHDRGVEQRILTNTTMYGPDEVAGVMEWYLGSLTNNEEVVVKVMLTVSNDPTQNRIPSLTHWGIIVLIALIILATVIVLGKRRKAGVAA